MSRFNHLALGAALVLGSQAPLPSHAASPAPRVLLNADEQVEVVYGGARVTGFAFAKGDQIYTRVQQVNPQGTRALIVGNARDAARQTQVRVPGPDAARVETRGAMPTVYTIVLPQEGLPARLDLQDQAADASAAGTHRVINRLGDLDNFGYGRDFGLPPCEFYDKRDGDDLGVFDHEDNSASDWVESWTHTFDTRGVPDLVKLATLEMFSDLTASTISLDGITVNFATEPYALCGIARRVFAFTGSDAAIAADGAINVVFTENGDDIVLDRSRLVVRFQSPD